MQQELYANSHLVIVRTSGSIVDINTYNCQELGLARALIRKGMRVSVILAGKNEESKTIGSGADKLNVYFVKYHCLNQSLAWFNNVEKLLNALNPTHIQIHEFGMLMSWRVLRWAKRNNVKCFLIQGPYQTTQKPIFRQLEHIFNCTFGKYILNNVDGVGCKNFMASKYVHLYSNVKVKQTFIGLDTSAFVNPQNKDWAHRLNIEGKKVLLYIGVLERRRNPDFLIEVLTQLPDDYVLLIVGGGSMENVVRNKVQEKGVGNKCRMLGKLEQSLLPSLYSISDVFLIASNYEIYGMVILEAMYFGVPVVSTLTAGSEVLVKDGYNGFIVDKDGKKWAEIIQYICKNTDKRKKMGMTASAFIKNNFVWDKACETFIELYTYH